MISRGEVTLEFENRVSNFIGTQYGLAMGSGTSALILALKCLGVGPGDAVVCNMFVGVF